LSYWDFSPNDSLRLKLSRQSPVLCSSRSLAPVYHSLAQIRQSYRRRDWPPACYRIQEVTGALPRRQKARGGVALAAGGSPQRSSVKCNGSRAFYARRLPILKLGGWGRAVGEQ
jgi:hypothetical protein